ncbi:MAG: hypothetical protein ACYDC1_06290 [Limisphaerales bacterium]
MEPELGGEKRVYVSLQEAVELGVLTITGADTGTWEATPGVTTPTGGFDIAGIVTTPDGLRGGAQNVTVTVAGKDGTDLTISGVAVFQPPSYGRFATKFFPIGTAADAVVTGGTKFKGAVANTVAVTGVTVDCAADSIYSKITLYAIPTLVWEELPGLDEFQFDDKSSVPVAIPQGMDGAKWKKHGRSRQGSFSFTCKSFQTLDDVTRFSGANLMLRVDVRKRDRVISHRAVLFDASFTTTSNKPDGETVATNSGQGVYEQLAIFASQAAA